MTGAELLVVVKTALGISGEFHDEILAIYIHEVQAYMLSAGVSSDVVNSPRSVGCVVIGVNDLWNYGAGQTKLSDYFKERCVQLAVESRGAENVST